LNKNEIKEGVKIMAARTIVGIVLGILFVPVIWIFLTTIASPSSINSFQYWVWSLLEGNFTSFLGQWVDAGMRSMVVPLMPSGMFPNSLIEGFGPGSLLAGFIPMYKAGLITWVVIGMWVGAIERRADRAIGAGVGIWLGWLIIELVFLAVQGTVASFLDWLLAQLLTLIIVIVVAIIFGAMTKSEKI
jgi:ABC-type glycerol-3-phosphate transport system permease component